MSFITERRLFNTAFHAIDKLYESGHDAVPSDLYDGMIEHFGRMPVESARRDYDRRCCGKIALASAIAYLITIVLEGAPAEECGRVEATIATLKSMLEEG